MDMFVFIGCTKLNIFIYIKVIMTYLIDRITELYAVIMYFNISSVVYSNTRCFI